MRNLRNRSTLVPITPAIPEAPASDSDARPAPTVTPDLKAERVLFELYQFEKARATANAKLYHDAVAKCRKVEDTFKKFKLKLLTKKLIPAHNVVSQ